MFRLFSPIDILIGHELIIRGPRRVHQIRAGHASVRPVTIPHERARVPGGIHAHPRAPLWLHRRPHGWRRQAAQPSQAQENEGVTSRDARR